MLTIGLLVSSYLPTSIVQAQVEFPREKTLIVRGGAKVAAPELYNPFLPTYVDWGVGGDIIVEHLFYRNLYNGTIIPWLGESFTYDAGFTGMTIKLRKGAYWNDGKPFTADDVVFTYEMLKANAPTLGYSSWVKEWFKDETAVDDYTVHITFTAPSARADYVFLTAGWPLPIVPKHVWEKVDPTTFKNWPNPVFTGAYMPIESTAERCVLKRLDKYWAKDVLGYYPAPEYVLITGFGSAEAMMVEQIEHRMDIWVDFTRSQYTEVMRRNKNVTVWDSLDPCCRNLWINTAWYPLNMSEFRWALNLAINKTKISWAAYEGVTVATKTPFPDYRGLDPFISEDVLLKYDITEYNVTKANEILDRLGFAKGPDGIRVTPNGTKLEYTVLSPPWAGHREGSQVVAESLRDIGIDGTYKVMEPAPWGDAWNRGEFKLLYAWACGAGLAHAWDPYGWYTGFHSRWVVPIGETAAFNTGRYNNSDVDRIVDALEGMRPDDPRAKPLYKEGLEIFLRELPTIPLVQSIFPTTNDNTYWTNWPSSTSLYSTPFHWWPIFMYVVMNLKSTMAPVVPKGYISIATTPIAGEIFVDGKLLGIGTATITPEVGATVRITFGDVEGYTTPAAVTAVAEADRTAANPQLVTAKYVAKPIAELGAIASELATLRGEVATLSGAVSSVGSKTDALAAGQTSLAGNVKSISDQVTALAGQLSTLTTAAAIEGVAIIVLAAALVVALRRK